MSTVSAREMIRAANKQNEELKEQLALLKEAEQKHKEELRQLDGEVEAAWSHFTQLVLPTLEPTVLDAASQRLHLPGISAYATQARFDQEKQQTEAAIAEIEASPAWVGRERISMEVSVRLREVREYKEPLEQSVKPLEKAPMFLELIRELYGTDAYSHKWYTLSYYRHWKRGDEIVEEFGPSRQSPDFATLRRKYLEERDALRSLQAREDELVAKQEEVDEKVIAHGRLTQGLQNLPSTTLQQARARVRSHISALEEADRIKLVNGAPDLELAIKRISGVEAKKRYLENLVEEMVSKPRKDIQRMLSKNNKDIAKLSRPKNQGRHFPRADYDRRFRDRSQSWNKRWRRYEDTRHQIIIFDRYDYYDPYREMLWWDVMTDGRLDGNFIPEVHHHHSHHPDWHHHHHGFHDDHAAAAIADEHAHGMGADLSDVS